LAGDFDFVCRVLVSTVPCQVLALRIISGIYNPVGSLFRTSRNISVVVVVAPASRFACDCVNSSAMPPHQYNSTGYCGLVDDEWRFRERARHVMCLANSRASPTLCNHTHTPRRTRAVSVFCLYACLACTYAQVRVSQAYYLLFSGLVVGGSSCFQDVPFNSQ
jgi:hypothetical protein